MLAFCFNWIFIGCSVPWDLIIFVPIIYLDLVVVKDLEHQDNEKIFPPKYGENYVVNIGGEGGVNCNRVSMHVQRSKRTPSQVRAVH